jgi:hypothetical protein
LPVGAKKGNTVIAAPSGADGDDVGWIYTESTGSISANTTTDETDEAGKRYNAY